ncbi:hypothetical protein EYF80_051696 [Liparis tanakae]|uniref:Uncharacterized protein n=1 Tax=Liparis tanakae TaxID=230148 RepID=A0A4Z2FBF3_9TELE|nr:hypothetical protein EYF80_051696 [Liparis tanakae]
MFLLLSEAGAATPATPRGAALVGLVLRGGLHQLLHHIAVPMGGREGHQDDEDACYSPLYSLVKDAVTLCSVVLEAVKVHRGASPCSSHHGLMWSAGFIVVTIRN